MPSQLARTLAPLQAARNALSKRVQPVLNPALSAQAKRLLHRTSSQPDDTPAPAADDNAPADPQALLDWYTHDTTLRDGTAVRLRPIVPTDKHHLQQAMSRMSQDSRYLRFMATLSELSPDRLNYLTEIDYENHFALVAFTRDQAPPQAMGVARYIRDPDTPDIAEPAVTVVDAFQGRGLGALLLQQLMTDATKHGIRCFRATLLADNQAMKQLFMRQGAQFKHEGFGVLNAEFPLPEAEQSRNELVYELVRHAYGGTLMRAQHVPGAAVDPTRRD